jgi:hypothetical protein
MALEIVNSIYNVVIQDITITKCSWVGSFNFENCENIHVDI